jgi:hypothetical protein
LASCREEKLSREWPSQGDSKTILVQFNVEKAIAVYQVQDGKRVKMGHKPWRTTPDGTSLRDYHQACTRMMRARRGVNVQQVVIDRRMCRTCQKTVERRSVHLGCGEIDGRQQVKGIEGGQVDERSGRMMQHYPYPLCDEDRHRVIAILTSGCPCAVGDYRLWPSENGMIEVDDACGRPCLIGTERGIVAAIEWVDRQHAFDAAERAEHEAHMAE